MIELYKKSITCSLVLLSVGVLLESAESEVQRAVSPVVVTAGKPIDYWTIHLKNALEDSTVTCPYQNAVATLMLSSLLKNFDTSTDTWRQYSEELKGFPQVRICIEDVCSSPDLISRMRQLEKAWSLVGALLQHRSSEVRAFQVQLSMAPGLIMYSSLRDRWNLAQLEAKPEDAEIASGPQQSPLTMSMYSTMMPDGYRVQVQLKAREGEGQSKHVFEYEIQNSDRNTPAYEHRLKTLAALKKYLYAHDMGQPVRLHYRIEGVESACNNVFNFASDRILSMLSGLVLDNGITNVHIIVQTSSTLKKT
jgi:hypothetical protein